MTGQCSRSPAPVRALLTLVLARVGPPLWGSALMAWTLGLALLGAGPAAGHEASMAVLVLREAAPGRYLGQWSLPPAEEQLRPIFPSHCTWTPPELECGERGFVGRLSFTGLGSKQSVAMICVFPKDGSPQAYTMSAANPVVTVARDPGSDLSAWLDLADTYVN